MEDTMGFGLQMARMVVSLAVVLIILLTGLYVLKRWGHWIRRTGSNSPVEVVAQHPLGPRHYLVVVKAQEQLLLLGISPQGLHFLTRIGTSPTTGDEGITGFPASQQDGVKP